jgi:hypothetical protein
MSEENLGRCQETGCMNQATDTVLVPTMTPSNPIDAPGMHYSGVVGVLTPKKYCKPHADAVRNAAVKP